MHPFKSKKIRFFSAMSMVVAVVLLLPYSSSLAQEMTSNSFILRDSTMTLSGDFSSSSNFQYFSNNLLQTSGERTSSSFQTLEGFAYFPFVSTPIVTATSGDSQVLLTWTSVEQPLGKDLSGYQIGHAIISGGPYTFVTVAGNGDVTSVIKTGLTNGTRYYFVVRAISTGNTVLVTSAEVSSVPAAPPPQPVVSQPPGGGGGGGFVALPLAQVIFTGKAYPKRTVTLLKDAQIVAKTVAASDADFEISLTSLSSGNYIFSVYSEDKEGNRSSLLTFPVFVTSGVTMRVSGIFIAPTIGVDKKEVRRGEDIAIFGQTAPKSEITIMVSSEDEFFQKVKSDKSGVYLYNFDTSVLSIGEHATKSKAALKNSISSFSKAVTFIVGTRTVPVGKKPSQVKKPLKGDLNHDGRVNLVDFSIGAFWYKRTLNEAFKQVETNDLNGDGKVDLVDFSIMAFYWTG